MTLGLVIEELSQRRRNVGSQEEPNWVNEYTLAELLDPKFQVAPLQEDEFESTLPIVEGIKYDEVK